LTFENIENLSLMLFRFIAVAVFFTAFLSFVRSQDSWNVELFALANRGDVRYSGSWSYVAPDGSEYALIGAKTGTAAYPIDNAAGVTELGFIPGPETNWREITTIGHHAFVVTDVQGSGHGMQVIDLSYLPDSLHLVTNYTETFTKGHIIQKAIDSGEPFVYVMGTSTTQGVHILDVSDPANPVQTGLYDPDYYIHDAHIRGNLLFAAAFYETAVDIVDISDKTNPVLIGKIDYEGTNTHSFSTTEDGKYLILADEQDGYPARIFNVEDIENPVEVAQYTANPASLVHNPYVRGDFCFISHNTEGLRVLDIEDPELPVEVGYYDTWTGASGGFNGLWSACPYFPSGKIIGGDRANGLYVWTFNNTKAARIYGLVTDSISNEPLSGVFVEITQLSDTLVTGFAGHFKKGMLEGSYTLTVSAPGYFTKTREIDLAQGDSIWVEMPLVPENFTATAESNAFANVLPVYPNPFSISAVVDLTNFKNAKKIFILNSLGAVVQVRNVTGGQLFEIPDGQLPGGKYWVVLLDERNSLLATARITVFN
jgi:choice-of-anchor B domain-containing protein